MDISVDLREELESRSNQPASIRDHAAAQNRPHGSASATDRLPRKTTQGASVSSSLAAPLNNGVGWIQVVRPNHEPTKLPPQTGPPSLSNDDLSPVRGILLGVVGGVAIWGLLVTGIRTLLL